MTEYIGLFVCFFVLCFFGHRYWEIWLHERHIGQAQKSYGPERGDSKRKTPALGGAVFMVSSIPAFYAGWALGDGSFSFQLALWSLPFGAGLIGLLDDLLKLKRTSSEGLSSLQKLGLQVILAFSWSLGLSCFWTLDLLPGLSVPFPWDVLLTAFITVSMLNGVNVTDGLDGLAAGASALSLLFLGFVISNGFSAVAAGLAMTLSFLWYNAYPARIFMGDCGSHFLGGLIVSVASLGGGVLYVIPSGALFGVEILSVAIQIFAIRVLSRKVFLMSPIHHHFELLGWKETQIVVRFWICHILGMLFLLLTGKFILGCL